jgi:Archaeal holliday junction resolvase (hjc)
MTKQQLRARHRAAEDDVLGALQDWGFEVTRIPTSNEHRTADLLAVSGDERYIVEVTTKSDSGEFAKALAAGELAEEQRVQQHSSTIQNMLKNKKRQLRATGACGFGVLWVEAIGEFGEPIADEVVATFLGHVGIRTARSSGGIYEKPCYFFDKAECFAHPQLDGVVAAHNGDARLLINPKALRAAEFRRSKLVAAFAPGVVDPPAEVAAGTAYTLEDYVGPRDPTQQNDRPRRAFLEQKYGVSLALPLQWRQVTIGRSVPMEELARRLAAASAPPGEAE